MKSYKEIFDEIEVEERLKVRTKEQMSIASPIPLTFRRVGLAFVCMIILFGAVAVSPLTLPSKKQGISEKLSKREGMQLSGVAKSIEKKVAVSNFHDYIIVEKVAKETYRDKTGSAYTSLDIVGEVHPMVGEILEKYQNKVPTAEQLIVPRDFKVSYSNYGQYTYAEENIGPYAAISYVFEGIKDSSRTIRITIQDKKIPRCIPIFMDNGKDYHGYQLCIYQNDEKQGFRAYAQKEELQYEIVGDDLSEPEFFALLESLFI